MKINIYEENAIIEAYMNGADLEELPQEYEDDNFSEKNKIRARRRKSSIAKNRRKKKVFADLSDAHQQYASIDFWDEENGSHGRNSDYKAFSKRLARKAVRRKMIGSGKSGYKKVFDLKYDLT